jgi:hypothetical protein
MLGAKPRGDQSAGRLMCGGRQRDPLRRGFLTQDQGDPFVDHFDLPGIQSPFTCRSSHAVIVAVPLGGGGNSA